MKASFLLPLASLVLLFGFFGMPVAQAPPIEPSPLPRVFAAYSASRSLPLLQSPD